MNKQSTACYDFETDCDPVVQKWERFLRASKETEPGKREREYGLAGCVRIKNAVFLRFAADFLRW